MSIFILILYISGFYIKLSLIHHGRVLKRKKTKTKSIKSPMLFNETFAFDIPQAEINNLTVVLSFRQRLRLEDSKRLSDITIGKTVLGAPEEHDISDVLWSDMVANAKKPILHWQAIW